MARIADGRTYSDMLFSGGGQGAWSRGDGKSGLLWPTSAANTSIELFEARVPVLVLEKGYLPDSGGAGEHRGGLGQRIRLRKLHDDGMTTLVSVYPEGVEESDRRPDRRQAGRRGFRPRASTPTAACCAIAAPASSCSSRQPNEIVELDPRRRLRLWRSAQAFARDDPARHCAWLCHAAWRAPRLWIWR